MSVAYRPRMVDSVLADHLEDFPAISLVGPRAAGKTTTALQHARSVMRLDDEGEAVVANANPDAALRDRAEPILIDEWQQAPAILAAVKRAVDADPRPGRFLLTGSVRADLQARTWPGTGRVIHLPLSCLSVREITGDASAEPIIERFARGGGAGDLRTPAEPLDLRDYVELALAGGFPEPALRLPPRARSTWFDGYVHQLVTRDAPGLEPGRDPVRMRRYVEVLALNTAGIVADKTLYEGAGIDRRTAEAYDRLLRNLYIVDAMPAWFSNRLKRLVKLPKRYLVDAALAATIGGIDAQALLRDPDALGRTLDTFVAAQLRAEIPACRSRPRLHHLRTEGGRQEIDQVVELAGGRIIGIEIKAAVSVPGRDARHLSWLRDELGDRFLHGLVLHTGPHIYPLGDRITAAPISTLWS